MTIRTKFGNASLSKKGYYVIHSREFGNRGKKLHRLIWEDFYGCKIPEGYVIHHKNNIKTDNCILNLQLMREYDHNSLHNKGENHHYYGKNIPDQVKKKMSEAQKGRKLPEETKLKISNSKNTTGYFRVSKIKCKECKQGYTWRYRYSTKDGRKVLESTDINKLKQKVLENGLPWKQLD